MTALLSVSFLSLSFAIIPSPAFAAEQAADKGKAKAAQNRDVFVKITDGVTGLKPVFDRGDHAEFQLTELSAEPALRETLAALSDADAVTRGDTSVWEIKNTGHGNSQAKTVTAMVRKDRTGRVVLTLDRRRGEQGRNPAAEERRAKAASRGATPPPPPPPVARSFGAGGKVVPPPALVD